MLSCRCWEAIYKVHSSCLEGVQRLSGGYGKAINSVSRPVLRVLGVCLIGVRRLYGGFMETL